MKLLNGIDIDNSFSYFVNFYNCYDKTVSYNICLKYHHILYVSLIILA